MELHARDAVDGILAVGGVTAPFWLHLLQTGFAVFMALGGAVLLALRIALAIREWRAGQARRRGSR